MVDRDSGAGSISLAEDKKAVGSHEKVADDSSCERPILNWLGSLGVRNYQGALSTRQIRFRSLVKSLNG